MLKISMLIREISNAINIILVPQDNKTGAWINNECSNYLSVLTGEVGLNKCGHNSNEFKYLKHE